MKKILFTILVFIPTWIHAEEGGGSLELTGSENKIRLQMRHDQIETVNELDILLKELDQLEQVTRLELKKNDDGGITWGIDPAPPVREINIKSGLRTKFQIDKIKHRYVGAPDSIFAQEMLVAELIEYFAYIGYPTAQLQLTRTPKGKSVAYDIIILSGNPCIIESIETPLQLPSDIKLNIKTGDVCDMEHIREEIDAYEKLLSDEGFQHSNLEVANAKYSPDYMNLQLTIDGILGDRINFEFIDETSLFISNPIDEDTASYFRKNYSDPLIVKQQIIEYFKSRGRDFPKVRGPYKQVETDNSLTYVYYINPGDRFQITDLVLEGNFQIPTHEIKDSVISTSFFELFSSDDTKTLEQVKIHVLDYYRSRGYWDVKILKAYIEYNFETKLATAHVTLEEGHRRTRTNITVTGNKAVPTSEITEMMAPQAGDALRQEDLSDFENKVTERYLNDGFLDATVDLIVDEPKSGTLEVSLEVQVTEGAPSYIGTISIHGLIETNAYVVERELLFKQGDAYNQANINKTRSALLNLGIFSSVAIERSDIKRSRERNEIDLVIEIREGDAGRVKFGPGYNFVRGLNYTGEVSHYHLWGTGRRITFRASLSEEKQQQAIQQASDLDGKTLLGRKLSVSYTEPYFLSLPVSGNISVYHQALADDVWKISNSLELSLTHTFNYAILQGSLTPFYRYQLLDTEGSPSQRDSLLTTGRSRIGSVGVRYRLDRRNSLSFPTGGFLFRTEASWARYNLLSQYRYFQWHVGNSYYIGMGPNTAIAINTILTSYLNVHRIDSSAENIDVLPANQRLTAGGPNDVRGFEKQLGPYVLTRNSGENIAEPPLGGSQLLIIKTEIRRQISPDLFSMSLFWDLGNSYFSSAELQTISNRFSMTNTATVQRTVEDNFNYALSDLLTHPDYFLTKNYHSAGFAMGLLTPIGALNASLAWPIREPKSVNCRVNDVCNPRQKDRNQWIQKVRLEFNIGAEF